jgi:hypothetical protein
VVELVTEEAEVPQVKWALQVTKVYQVVPAEPVNQVQKVPKVQSVLLVTQVNEVCQATVVHQVNPADQVDVVLEVHVALKVPVQLWPIFYLLYQVNFLAIQELMVKMALQVQLVNQVFQVNKVQ